MPSATLDKLSRYGDKQVPRSRGFVTIKRGDKFAQEGQNLSPCSQLFLYNEIFMSG
jgi:hypothetical protein